MEAHYIPAHRKGAFPRDNCVNTPSIASAQAGAINRAVKLESQGELP